MDAASQARRGRRAWWGQGAPPVQSEPPQRGTDSSQGPTRPCGRKQVLWHSFRTALPEGPGPASSSSSQARLPEAPSLETCIAPHRALCHFICGFQEVIPGSTHPPPAHQHPDAWFMAGWGRCWTLSCTSLAPAASTLLSRACCQLLTPLKTYPRWLVAGRSDVHGRSFVCLHWLLQDLLLQTY